MEFFTSRDGLKLAYRLDGDPDGLPLLCLAGLTRNSTDFDYVLPYLTGCNVIRADYRGRGASDWSPQPATYSIPVEAQDALDLIDHLGLERVAVLGTSRGGLIGLTLGVMARHRLIGICFNDIGPVIEPVGLDVIKTYVGRRPAARTHAELAQAKATLLKGFADVPPERWLAEAQRQSVEVADGLQLTYDPALRQSVLAAEGQPLPDLWPFYDGLAGMPLALIRGANSDLLSETTAAEMKRRIPELIYADVPGRAHVPFLDEPEALGVLSEWLKECRSQ